MRLVKCSGISMESLIKNNDIIGIDESTKIIKHGDIIIFKLNGMLFAHRSLMVLKDKILEFGENAKIPNWVLRTDVIGVAKCLISEGHIYDLTKVYYPLYLFLWVIAIYKLLFFKALRGKYMSSLYIKLLGPVNKYRNRLQKKSLLLM